MSQVDGTTTIAGDGASAASGGDESTMALEMAELTCRFGALAAVDSVTFSVKAGARFGIIGPNGAGKTTLFNLLSGEIKPTSGTVRFFGRDVSRLSAPSRAQLGMCRTFQITRVFTTLTVRENLTLALMGLSPSKMRMLRPWRRSRSFQSRVEELAHSFGLGDRLELVASHLSHGELRELEVLLALAVEPKVLLLDEPAAGLSPAERVDIQELLRRLPKDLTMVMVEHDMNVLREVVDWVAVLHYGQLVTQGPTAEVQRHPAVRELYLGSAADKMTGGPDASDGAK